MPDPVEDLRAIEGALGAFEPAIAEAHFGVRLMQQSLEQRREEVVAEMAGRLDLGLTQDERFGTGAELPLVAGVLGALQDTLASIAQVIAGEPTARGLIPAAIKESVQLRIAAATPGSLNMRLVPATPMQEPLFEDGRESLMELSIDRLLGLFTETVEEDRESLLQDIADLGPRVTAHVQTLSNWLAEGHANARLSWRSRSLDRATRLDTRGANRLRDILRTVADETRELTYTGRLVGGSLVRRTFELQLEPDESTVIAGRVSEESLPAMEAIAFGQEVTAVVIVRQSRLPSGETKESHLLRTLAY